MCSLQLYLPRVASEPTLSILTSERYDNSYVSSLFINYGRFSPTQDVNGDGISSTEDQNPLPLMSRPQSPPPTTVTTPISRQPGASNMVCASPNDIPGLLESSLLAALDSQASPEARLPNFEPIIPAAPGQLPPPPSSVTVRPPPSLNLANTVEMPTAAGPVLLPSPILPICPPSPILPQAATGVVGLKRRRLSSPPSSSSSEASPPPPPRRSSRIKRRPRKK